jgi:hypothetical protein
MRRWARILTVLAAAAPAAALAPAAAPAVAAKPAPPVVAPATGTAWTKISTTTHLGIASAGLLRTTDGKLHVVWPRQDGSTFSIHYSTLGGKAKLLGTGTVVQKWAALSLGPRLIPGPGGGMRMVFAGGNGVSGSPFNRGAMYLDNATSAGTTWKLFSGSISHSTLVPLTDTAATTESNGTPVAAWSSGNSVSYHVGMDSSIPSTAPDSTVTAPDAVGPALIRKSDGSVWAAWFSETLASNQGYYAARILPSKQASKKAPGSGGQGRANNHPLQAVAFARAGTAGYLAYCSPTRTVPCAQVDLWKVGATKAAAVRGSSTGTASRVAIAPAPGGHLWIVWYDSGRNKIRVDRTNAAGTRFGPAHSIAVPPAFAELDGLQAEGSRGPLDVVALIAQSTSGLPVSYWDTQLLPALSLAASPTKVRRGGTVTFTVTDVGDPVPGATVTFLGKTATTSARGIARIRVPRHTARGKYKARASKSGYTTATFKVRVR